MAIVAADHPETARHAASKIEVDYEVLTPVTDPEKAIDAEPLHPSGNLLRHVHIEHGDPIGDGRRRGQRRVRGRHAGPGLPRPRVRARGAGRGRRRRPLRRHPVAARRPRPDRGQPRPAGREGAAHARRRRRRVRRPRGPVDAGPRVHARAAHRQAGEDDVRPRGVVLRPRPPPPGVDALRARRRRATATSSTSRPDPARRRRLRVEQHGGVQQRGVLRGRAVRGAERADRLLRRLHQQPAVRRDARLRRRADLLRARGADGQAGRRAGDRPGRAAAPQRDVAGHGRSRPARAIDSPAPVAELLDSVSARPLPGPSEIMPGGHSNTTHGEGVRRGIGYAVGFKNICFSEGFDDYSTARVGCRWSAASRWPRSTPRPPRSARGWSRCRSRSRGTSSGWSG